MARVSVLLSAVGSDDEVVGIGGLSEAMEWRRELSGSWAVVAILALSACNEKRSMGELWVMCILHVKDTLCTLRVRIEDARSSGRSAAARNG